MTFDKLSGIASVLGLAFTLASYFTVNHPIHFWLLSFTALIFIFLCCYTFKRYSTATKYLDGEADIRNMYNSLIADYSKIKEKNFEGVILELTGICTEIAESFEKIKKTKIGVCIKYTNGNLPNLYTKTLCRDSHSRNMRKEIDAKNELDYIKQNTDFNYIIELAQNESSYKNLFYIGNRLANLHQYNNSHLHDIDLPSGLWSYYVRRKEWPLPYRSTIVVPFVSPNNKKIVDGFLCIDSPSSNGFNKERDVAILQQIALFMRDLISYICIKHLNKA